jgi:hypothetical protein
MVKTRVNQRWPRRGFALLWDADVLASLVTPKDVVSLRQFFSKVHQWRDEDLTAANSNALVVSGVEGCLDVLSGDDAVRWIETDLKEAVLSFQDFSQGDGGLILWMPSGRNRITMKGASEAYYWKHRHSGKDGLPIGQLLFSGAENEVERLLNTDDPHADYDGKHWVGLHHPRIS